MAQLGVRLWVRLRFPPARMKSGLLRFAGALSTALRVIAGTLLILSVAINSVNIFGRYVLSHPLEWAEEMMLFLMVGSVFLANALVGYADRQIRMDVIVSLLPPKVRAVLKFLSDLLFIATAVALTVFALPVIYDLWSFDQRSVAANFPMFIPQAMVPLGLLLTAVLVAVRLMTRKPGEAPGSDH